MTFIKNIYDGQFCKNKIVDLKIKVCCFKSNLLKIFTMANPDQLDPDMNFLNDVKPT